MREQHIRNQRGMSSGTVIGILALLVAVGAGLYFWSDVFRTKADAALRQMSEWTPENIAKDPVNYLNFCEEQTKDALDKLKAAEISVAQRRGKLAAMKEESNKKIGVGDKALTALKTLYRTADPAGAFPVTWNGKSYDKESCQKQILSLHGQVNSQKTLLAKIESGLKKLDTQKNRIIDQRAKAKRSSARSRRTARC